ncbi:histidine kinase [Halobacteriales archaeon QS_5_68_33]|nr:MAG: histidine kinase [Halobacteriales archaeon QS_5_68_33]
MVGISGGSDVDDEPNVGARYDIVAQAPVGITVCDPSEAGTPVVYANERFEEITGYAESELLGEPWHNLQDPETRAEARERIERARDRAESVTVELRLYRADGDPFWDRVRIVPLRDETGAVADFVAFHDDITDEKQREETMQALHSVATHIQTDETVEAACERTIEAAARILEFDKCTIVLQEGEWLVPTADSTDIPSGGTRRMRVDQGLAGATFQTGESMVVDDVDQDETSDPAKETYKSAISVPIGDHGVFQAVKTETHAFDEADVEHTELLVSHTASAIERIEREQELQRQNERLESFVSVVSHDLRNPLNVLGGALELARQTGEPEHFERGKRAYERMEELIDDLLTLARQGEDVERLETVGLGRIADESWKTAATAEAALAVETDLAVRCHEGRFRELLENLFRNAIEHGGEDATVTVGELTSADGFFVADDGPGVPPEHRDQVFESGFSTAEDGTGFGLSIVDQIAAAHDWEVRVAESDAGGARFEVVDVDVVA